MRSRMTGGAQPLAVESVARTVAVPVVAGVADVPGGYPAAFAGVGRDDPTGADGAAQAQPGVPFLLGRVVAGRVCAEPPGAGSGIEALPANLAAVLYRRSRSAA